MGAATFVAMLGFHLTTPQDPPPGIVASEEKADEASAHVDPRSVSGRQHAAPTLPDDKAATGERSKLTGDPSVWGLGADELGLPIAGLRPEQLYDTFEDARGSGERAHEALDIMAPRGTPVLAMVDGKIRKLFESEAGGLTVYQFDLDETYCYYYAHLDRYAEGLVEGKMVKRGDVLGYVGSTGNASEDAPHLHLAIYRLGPEKNWWEGTPVNPYPILERLVKRARRG